MSLFNSIANAINNSNQQANPNQLSGIIDTVQQLSNNYQTDPGSVQTATSIVGKYVRSALQQKRQEEGEENAQSLVNQFSGTQPNTQVIQMLFNTPQLKQLLAEVETRTGLSAATVQAMLPFLVPLVLNLLQTGASTSQPNQSNAVLHQFLDADNDGDVDIADAMQMASRYLKR
ncbi:MAG: hypothetical protein ACOC0N_03560 [Chroococcales cyanobacterium]